jgi:dolichyl-phosphate beta-glucosyltransferase
MGPRVGTLSLVVPLYNEVDRFAESLDALLGFVADAPAGSELIFVDDGSTDGTAEAVEKALASVDDVDAQLLARPRTGKGAAVQAGLLIARGDDAGFCDVDLATPLANLAEVLAVARRTGGLAVGSRALSESNLVRHEWLPRELLGRCYNGVVRLSLVRGIHDTQCGAKMAPTSVWRRLFEHTREVGFAWDVEIVAVAQRLGIPVDEVPITWSHDGRTRVRPLRDGLAMLRAVPRVAMRARALSRSERTERAAPSVPATDDEED